MSERNEKTDEHGKRKKKNKLIQLTTDKKMKKNTHSKTEKDRDKVFEEVKNIKTITRNTRQRTKLVKMKHED